MTHIVVSQSYRLNVISTSSSHQGDLADSRVNRFLQFVPSVFTRTKPEEYPQEFIDEIHNTLCVMHATKIEGVELASYHLKEVAYT